MINLQRYLILAGLGIFQIPIIHAENSYPKLFFSYSYLYDSNCEGPNYKIDPAWAEEADQRAPEFQTLWENNSLLIKSVVDYFKTGFSRKELTATLSVCNTGSMSNPLIVNVRPQLKSFMSPDPVRPESAFTDSVFHELLHTFVAEHLPAETPLLKKYKAEPELVKNHLHVFAIEKLIYTQLQRTSDLDWLNFLNHRIGGEYLRAWDIVNTEENYQSFIDEFGPH